MVEFSKFGAPRPSIISASRATPGGAGTQAIATAGSFYSSRTRHVNKTGKRVHGLSLLYTNYGPSSSTEGQNGNPLQVKAAIEYDGTPSGDTGVRAQVGFRGTRLLTVDRGITVISDPDFSRVVEPAGVVYERTGVTVGTNAQVYQRSQVNLGGTSQWGLDTGEGTEANQDKIDDAQGTISNNVSSSYSAVCLLGYPLDGTIATSIAILGDSIQVGTDDGDLGGNSGGWAERTFADYPFVKLPIAGEKLTDFVNPKNSFRRMAIASYATHILDAYGRNDLGASRTLDQFKADVLANAYRFMARGQPYIKSTILPSPTSSDGWFTVAGQTKETNDALRVSYNSWLRDTGATGFVAQAMAQVASIGGAGFAKVKDVCAPVECNISGVLTTDGGYLLGAQTAKLKTGTASAGSTTSLTTSGLVANAHKGQSLYIVSGTGAGQSRTIAYNSTTVLTVANAFSVALDNTSVFEVFEALGMTGVVHPHTKQNKMIADYWAPRLEALLAA